MSLRSVHEKVANESMAKAELRQVQELVLGDVGELCHRGITGDPPEVAD